jgi:sulfonate transport system ATP-binding protein
MTATADTLLAAYAQRYARDVSEPMPQPPVAARLRGVEKSFDGVAVLRGIDLDIPSGQFVAIVGRSGCGKSTLLRLLAGLDTPTAGWIGIGNDGGAPGEQVRLMFQEPRLLPWARVRRNVEVGLSTSGGVTARRRLSRAVRAGEAQGSEALANEALARVDLADRADDWPAVLSGGQKQRVALARALVSRPRAGQPPAPPGPGRTAWRARRADPDRHAGVDRGGLADTTFHCVLVTHDVAEAVTLADRVLVLEDGRITADIAVALPRPRRMGDADAARIEGRILDYLLSRDVFAGELT